MGDPFRSPCPSEHMGRGQPSLPPPPPTRGAPPSVRHHRRSGPAPTPSPVTPSPATHPLPPTGRGPCRALGSPSACGSPGSRLQAKGMPGQGPAPERRFSSLLPGTQHDMAGQGRGLAMPGRLQGNLPGHGEALPGGRNWWDASWARTGPAHAAWGSAGAAWELPRLPNAAGAESFSRPRRCRAVFAERKAAHADRRGHHSGMSRGRRGTGCRAVAGGPLPLVVKWLVSVLGHSLPAQIPLQGGVRARAGCFTVPRGTWRGFGGSSLQMEGGVTALQRVRRRSRQVSAPRTTVRSCACSPIPTHGPTSLLTSLSPSSSDPLPPCCSWVFSDESPPFFVCPGLCRCPHCVCVCCPSLPYHVFVQSSGAINCSNICRDVHVWPKW